MSIEYLHDYAAKLHIIDEERRCSHIAEDASVKMSRRSLIGNAIEHGSNDVLMFHSIAMGNASDEVKAPADATIDSYNNENFAKAMGRFIVGWSD